MYFGNTNMFHSNKVKTEHSDIVSKFIAHKVLAKYLNVCHLSNNINKNEIKKSK